MKNIYSVFIKYISSIIITLMLVSCSSGGDSSGSGSSSSSSSSSSSNSFKITVKNATTTDSVWYLYIAPSSNSNWGSDILGDNIITPGASRGFTLTNSCNKNHDFKAVFSLGAVVTKYDEYVECGKSYTWTIAQ